MHIWAEGPKRKPLVWPNVAFLKPPYFADAFGLKINITWTGFLQSSMAWNGRASETRLVNEIAEVGYIVHEMEMVFTAVT